MKMKGMEVRRGEIWFANLGTGKGSEQSGVRPCVVIQNDTGNAYSPTVIIAPCTTGNKTDIPTHILLNKGEGGTRGTTTILLEQLRTLDSSRFQQKIGILDDVTMKKVDLSLAISLGLDRYIINVE